VGGDDMSSDRAQYNINFNSFDLVRTLECGQCFRANKINEECYKIIASGKYLVINTNENTLPIHDKFWREYFDVDRDYGEIAHVLSHNDKIMEKVIAHSRGIRILNQEPWETLISFVISQNNGIANIKRVVERLSECYGELMEDEHAFPTPEAFLEAGKDGILACKAGYRNEYIINAARAVLDGVIPLGRDDPASTSQLKARLMSVKGIGEKVADCILLYGYGRTECFPCDVWIIRAMRELYFGGEKVLAKNIQAFVAKKFGKYAGFANIWLFDYARDNL